MVTPAGVVLLSLSLTASPRVENVDEPVADVAAFFVESCAGVPAKEKRSCESGVAQNRARISSTIYLARVELGRFYAVRGQRSVFKVVGDGGRGGAAVELNFVLGAETMADAPDACLALGARGRTDYWHHLEGPINPAGAAPWQKRIDHLLARSPGPQMTVETLFRVNNVARVGPIGPCAVGEPLLLRLLDGESGEVLASFAGPDLPASAVPRRPLHSSLAATTASNDSRSEYLAAVRTRIAKSLAPRVGQSGASVTLRVVIGEDGRVVRSDVAHSSGDASVDRSVRDALRRASPLPAPPAALRPEVSGSGLLVEVRP
jgi:TonB family protein